MIIAIVRFLRKHVAPADRMSGATLGLFGWPWLFPTDAPSPPPGALFAAATLAVLVGVAFQVAHIRANVRLRAAWDHYAELELVPATILVQPVRQQERGR
jgi:hypothetical protein